MFVFLIKYEYFREFAENQFQIPNQENMMIFKNQDFQNTTGIQQNLFYLIFSSGLNAIREI